MDLKIQFHLRNTVQARNYFYGKDINTLEIMVMFLTKFFNLKRFCPKIKSLEKS